MSKRRREKSQRIRSEDKAPTQADLVQIKNQLDLGIDHYQSGRLQEAEACYQQLLQWDPDNIDANNNLGVTLQKQGKLAEAVQSYQRVLQINPNYASTYNNLGAVLKEQGKLEEAVQSYQRAIKLNPNYTDTHYNLGILFQEQGKLEESVQSYQQAIKLNPNHAEAHFNLALVLLLIGDFRQGWKEYEWRWATKRSSDSQPKTPMWNGSNIEGKSIVLWNDQGLGDAIEFVRYAKKLQEQGAKVVLSIQTNLVRLFRECLSDQFEVVERNLCDIYTYDYHAPIMSLLGIFQTDLDNIPCSIPYIFPPKSSPSGCLLPTRDSIGIGIVWATDKINPSLYRKKSCLPELFIDLLDVGNISLYSLQVGEDAPSIEPWLGDERIHNLSPVLKDFTHTASIVEQLDLVITVDTAVAHLAGAMGKPVWVLLPFIPDWRWFLERQDSPWYPTMRLFRQPTIGDWSSVFEEVKGKLKSVVKGEYPLFPVEKVRLESQGIGPETFEMVELKALPQADSVEIKKQLDLGIDHYQSGRLQEAEACYQNLLHWQPDNIGVLNLLAVIAARQGQYQIATERIERVLQLNPNYADAYNNLGVVLRKQGKLEEAIQSYQRALQINPNYAEAYNNLGVILKEQGKLEESIQSCQRALQINPNYADPYNNLGNVLWEQGKLDEAIQSYQRALQINPNYADSYNSLGAVLHEQGKLDEAIQSYQSALHIDPNYADAHFNLALGLLLAGDFKQGWKEYEWRSATKRSSGSQPKTPIWNGSNIEGKSIVLWNDQGLGDAIQSVRYAKKLQEQGAKVVLSIQNNLVRLFRECLSDQFEVVEKNLCDIYAYDYHASIMSLPGIFQTDLDNIPSTIPYIFPPNPLPSDCILPYSDSFRIGIVWAAGKYNPSLYQKKSCEPELFIDLLNVGNISLYSLQVGEDDHQIEPWLGDERVHNLSPVLKDFTHTASIIEQLDLVITVDTAVAHLAGAMGKPVWVLLPFIPDWRWLLERQDSPWYPTMRLFRQPRLGDWEGVFVEISRELGCLVVGETKQVTMTKSEVQGKDMSPDSEDYLTYFNLGMKCCQEGELIKAEENFRRAISLNPNYVGAYNNLGVVLWQKGLFREAEEILRQGLVVNPNDSDAHGNLGILLKKKGLFTEAQQHYQQAIRLNPHGKNAYYNLVRLLEERGLFSEAGQILFNLGVVLYGQGLFAEAENAFRQSISLRGNSSETYYNLGLTLKEMGKLKDAVETYRQAIVNCPNYSEAYNNLGNVLLELGQLEDAEQNCRRALTIKPHNVNAYINLGNILRAQGILTHQETLLIQAEQAYQQAVSQSPNLSSPHVTLALFLLLQGKFKEGWEEYEWRLQSGEITIPYSSKPQWDGSELGEKILLLMTEQGVGDGIQFIRYVPVLYQKKIRLKVLCDRSLVTLFQEVPGLEVVIAKEEEDEIPAHDVYLPLMSLPRLLGTNSNNIPLQIPYLRASKPSPITLDGNQFKVGIVWASSITNKDLYKKKSCSPDLFLQLLLIPEVVLYSLQVGKDGEQIKPHIDNQRIFDPSAYLKDFSDTASIIEQLDLVITVDTAVAHLAGAMGKPVWVLLSFIPDWRWLLERQDSPWYPTMRLFRQPRLGDWSSVFEEVKEKLKSVVKGESPLFPIEKVRWESQGISTETFEMVELKALPQADSVQIKRHLDLGVEHHQSGRLQEAEACYQQVLQWQPDNPVALHLWGVIASQQTNYQIAIERIEQALQLNPNYAAAHNNLGLALQKQGKLEQALQSYQRALQLNPNCIDAHLNLGAVFQEQGKLEESIQSYQRALQINPNYADVYYNLGNVLWEQGKLDEAIQSYQRALQINPNYADSYNNLGAVLHEQGKLDQAIQSYQSALEINPNYADAHFNLALGLLLAGDFKQGWKEYEWRSATKRSSGFQPKTPMWNGSNIEGKSIVLWNDQGLGDAIQFLRYAEKLPEQGAKVVLSTPTPLVSLFRECLSDQFEVVEKNLCDIYTYDYHASIMHLLGIFQTDLDNIPCSIPYIFPPKPLPSDCILPTRDSFGIGIVWAAGKYNPTLYQKKSCSPELFIDLLNVGNISLHSLQVGEDAPSIEPWLGDERIHNLSPVLRDFTHTASIIEQLDLVITVDTAVAHLAGAMGKPVWVLLPFAPDWRWLLERQDSPWYPTMRLFRQPRFGDWESVFEEVKGKLKEVLDGESPIFPVGGGATTGASPLGGGRGGLPLQVVDSLNEKKDKSTLTHFAPQNKTIAIQFSSTRSQHLLGIGWGMNLTTGWGNYGLNLVLQLQQMPDFVPILLVDSNISDSFNPLHRELLQPLLDRQGQWQKVINQNQGKQINLNIPVLHALGNSFDGGLQDVTGDRNIGVVFFENTQLLPNALEKARKYDLIVAGSHWNAKVLQSHGLKNVRVVLQGIDPGKFHPAPRSNLLKNRFVIFSGGKLEYRKGQDIVVAAFRRFVSRHPDALLLTAWHNFWPQFMQGIDRKGHVKGVPQLDGNKCLQVKEWLVANGIPDRNCINVGLIPNHLMGQVVREADVAVFTNRGEGGTNLVAMECLACGIPSILSANTGHLDLIRDNNCYALSNQSSVKPTQLFPNVDGWGESDVDEIVEALERVYNNREEARRIGAAAAVFMQDWTWEKQIRRFCDVLIEAGIVD